MSGNRNSLVESTKDTKSIALQRDKNHEDMKKSKDYERNQELLRKYIFTDGFTEADYLNSTGEKVNSKSSSYDYDAATSYDDVNYSEYDFDDEEEASCNVKFNFRLFRDTEIPMSGKKKYKNGTRSSLTFSNQRVKEIERDNRILLEKIMRNGPSFSGDSFAKQQSTNNNQRPKMKSAAEVNREKKQQQIYYENQLLKRKLDKIATRRASVSSSLG